MRSTHETTAALLFGTAEFMGRPLRFSRPKDYRPPEGEEMPESSDTLSNNVRDSPHKVKIFHEFLILISRFLLVEFQSMQLMNKLWNY